MAELLPGTYRCAKCGEWWAQAHACPIATNFTKIGQRPETDCRTCKSFYHWEDGVCKQSNKNPCINADRYQPLPPVRLWKKT
jgi:hypothetical protein